MKVAGIYGFETTRLIEFNKFRIEPFFNDHVQAKKRAKQKHEFNLTAAIFCDSLSVQDIFEISSALTFIEQSKVVVSNPLDISNNDKNWKEMFERALLTRRQYTHEEIIGRDLFFRDSRELFLEKLFHKIDGTRNSKNDSFSALYYKCVECCRLENNIVDIVYFLLFSGLESYCRMEQDIKDGGAAQPIANQLQELGFNISQVNTSDLKRSVQSYTHVRNALFHLSEWDKDVDIDQKLVTFSVYEFLRPLSVLVPLVVLKSIGFNDGHTNWDGWYDRIKHK